MPGRSEADGRSAWCASRERNQGRKRLLCRHDQSEPGVSWEVNRNRNRDITSTPWRLADMVLRTLYRECEAVRGDLAEGKPDYMRYAAH